jgi:hypothetical protein
MAERIVVDPITRIEGHLRIEADVGAGVITDAYSSGTMVRGLEIILRGRDPRDAWAFTERACGVCTTVHALASVRTVENALGIIIPPNAELVRNLMFGAHYLQDRVVHFYVLHALDWVDVVSALRADPQKTADLGRTLSSWPKNSVGYFRTVQRKVQTLVESGQLGIFANAYWGHPGYKLPPEVNLLGGPARQPGQGRPGGEMNKIPYAEYYQVYVWELPVRFFHWANALCVFILGVTGYLIGSPPSCRALQPRPPRSICSAGSGLSTLPSATYS